MRVIERWAPAKINLGLCVTGRRADGYHLLESLFLPLTLADRLEVSLAEPGGSALRVAGDAAEGVPSDDRNLALRAARAFCAAAGLAAGVSIRLEKRVPAAGGLGGGSSDAAAVLTALAELAPGRLTTRELAALALELGADVPFFLDPTPAWVEGVGERIQPLAGIPALSLLLVHPGEPLATADVFRAYAAERDSLTLPGAASSIRRLLRLRTEAGGLSTGRFEGTPGFEGATQSADRGVGGLGQALAGLTANDLEAVAARLCPAVARIREEIESTRPLAVGMSGSGPTVYGVYEDETQARAAARQLPSLVAAAGAAATGDEATEPRGARGARGWVTRSLGSRMGSRPPQPGQAIARSG